MTELRDEKLLAASQINRTVINNQHSITMYSDTHFFVVEAKHTTTGFGPKLTVQSFKLEHAPRFDNFSVVRQQPAKEYAKVVRLADYRRGNDHGD